MRHLSSAASRAASGHIASISELKTGAAVESDGDSLHAGIACNASAHGAMNRTSCRPRCGDSSIDMGQKFSVAPRNPQPDSLVLDWMTRTNADEQTGATCFQD